MSLRTKVCFVVLGSLFAFLLDINESVSTLYASFYGTCFFLFYFNNFHEQFKQIGHIKALSFNSTLVTIFKIILHLDIAIQFVT